MTNAISTGTLGFPRMGGKRELKFALEKYWKGTISEQELLLRANSVEEKAWNLQSEIDHVTVGDHYLYDSVLSWSEFLGLFPKRFENCKPGLPRMFAMARGIDGAPALSMKKWITSNYHYIVPEVDETTKISPDFDRFLGNCKRGVDLNGKTRSTPVVLGPVSWVRLARIASTSTATKQSLIADLIPVYKNLLLQIKALGVKEIQIHEPVLVFDETELLPLFKSVYPAILPEGVSINMVSSMEDVGESNYKWLQSKDNGIDIVSLDFTRGETLQLIEKNGWTNKTLGAGLIDARNVWKVIPEVTLPIIEKLNSLNIKYRVQPSGSLQYTPWDFDNETALKTHVAANVLSFAKQKLGELKIIAAAAEGTNDLSEHFASWHTYHVGRKEISKFGAIVAERIANLEDADFVRSEDYATRRPKQLVGTPLLPTTTIGSFPQTKEIRKLRSLLNKGTISTAEYEAAMDLQISFCIGIQEALGLDILVHGEPERTDMVEFFAQQMEGMLFSQQGWVQSFGTRCVRPPIFWTDIHRPEAMTTREYEVAQALTTKPVKGMLTGPITILNWSFPRVDISRKEQAFQIGLGIRDEISSLEKSGCTVIQVDEPALREGMPMRDGAKEEYLTWAVNAFCLSTAGSKSSTQIHTHMCYCEFDDCMEAIDRMDTDVNSIENARSDNATLEAFKRIGYSKGFGPGLYDIHSPVVPPVDEQYEKLKSFLECLDIEQTVVNPDCGLKTRAWPETIAALRNMVAATLKVREELGLVKDLPSNAVTVEEKKCACH
mmetsp:Transcript_23993/g.54592  ORF Transcript_23993/g.54592 Transcript_23993/m.54592 type:complete len:776 (-) Transcript_23993:91-2418(-)|eukprot:CAMPEP_0113313118 /NCGR_PEP_ID=MMETSP0010_2-20120614/9667_1 /TAXON_ID=216773 ORGANISM="Corethron hystrix, Strain 308" /NCGR_SAMPLE_ID=MMETSP0010_2 /ASSEMBLY_ACC=CAM_ASM_000155 /LENGTH=775 /DNA_ID=CAMNT_0000169061 /DNA_START=676 /DNA_END=3003 /DNA_ORIENTATION=- /assembly_acc=CAM_ASM_000155